MNLDEVLVVNFAVDERTLGLSDHCIKSLGFKKVVTLRSDNSFREKFLQFAELAVNSDAKCFLRSDADRLLFEGTVELVKEWDRNKSLQCVEGQCFDFLMNKYRGATPHLFSREAMEKLHENHDLMPDSQKPESRFVENITQNKKNGWLGISALTNLHDYEQYPSKVCNTIVNRISRGHFHYLYDLNYVSTLSPDYQKAFAVAQGYVQINGLKSRLDYEDFSYLDHGMHAISDKDIVKKYEHYKAAYESLKSSH